MDITFKTVDKQKFNMSVDVSDSVEDLIDKVGIIMRSENIYWLAHTGSILREGTLVKEYNLSATLPVIVMVTKQAKQISNNEDMENVRLH